MGDTKKRNEFVRKEEKFMFVKGLYFIMIDCDRHVVTLVVSKFLEESPLSTHRQAIWKHLQLFLLQA